MFLTSNVSARMCALACTRVYAVFDLGTHLALQIRSSTEKVRYQNESIR